MVSSRGSSGSVPSGPTPVSLLLWVPDREQCIAAIRKEKTSGIGGDCLQRPGVLWNSKLCFRGFATAFSSHMQHSGDCLW